jgi:hypothetical protein
MKLRRKNMRRKSESGQAIILLALALVGLLGFTSLAIDGAMVYSDRRNAQSVSDAAALAGGGFAALSMENANPKIYFDDFDCSSATVAWIMTNALTTAKNRALSNDFADAEISVSAICEDNGPADDEKYIDVTAQITRVTNTVFMHFVYPGPAINQVEAIVRVRPRAPIVPFSAGFAIVSMHDCVSAGANNYAFTGGGNSGGVETWNGGMFINSPDSSGNCCSIDSPNSSGAIGVIAHDGFEITSVGSCTHNGDPNVSPSPIQAGYNGGAPMTDPLPNLVMPTCSGSSLNNVIVDGVTYDYGPGNISGGLNSGTYAPGVYCITGDTQLSGQSSVTANGVVFYFIDGGLRYTGNAGMTLTAPTADNCSGDACSYIGIALLAARNNTSIIEVRGNGGNAIVGLVYTLTGSVQARGGGSDPDETIVIGQVITGKVLGNGNGSFKVTYAQTYEGGTSEKPTTVDLNE